MIRHLEEVTMKTILSTVCAITLIFGGASLAVGQDKGTAAKQSKEVQQETKTMTPSGTAKTSTDTVYGKVESYEPGKSIKVTVPGKVASTKSFDLDSKNTTANVAPDVKPGEWVKVTEKTDNNGHKTITVHRSEKHASRTKRTSP
jgi:hypothetical protein